MAGSGDGRTGRTDAGTPRRGPRRGSTGADSTSARGRRGEDLAAAHLGEQGFVLLERNFRCRLGELDIVARDGDTLVFVEVRSRASGGYGDPLETVNARKQKRLARVAQVYLSRRRPKFSGCRFDVIGIVGERIAHVRDAFRLDSSARW